jgi:iron complex outermembrane receptor protein
MSRIFSRTYFLNCVGVATMAASAFVQPAMAETFNLDIPAQPLGDALQHLSKQTGYRLLLPSQDIVGYRSRRVAGALSAREALDQLIEGTPLKIASIHGRIVALSARRDRPVAMQTRRPARAPIRLAALQPSSDLRLQEVPAPTAEPVSEPEITVTGSRIERNGYRAPTPVTVIGRAEIEAAAPENIADYVNTLPAVVGSQTAQSNTLSTGQGSGGVNALNLRNLGELRTLVLVDGQRSVGSLLTGVVDINTIPQQLISRVDVVTAGASAAYGSDAVSGVVNFVLDKTYQGTKGEVSGGATTYGDNINWQISLAHGRDFADGRGHILLSGEYAAAYGVKGQPRDWINRSWGYVVNPAYGSGAGKGTSVPQYLVRDRVGNASFVPGGIIAASGANNVLRGIAFGPGGVPYRYDYGEIDTPPLNVGGDWAKTNMHDAGDLAQQLLRYNLFGRASFEFSPALEVFGQVQYSRSDSENRASSQTNQGNIVIRAGNPFIPESVRLLMQQNGLTQFSLGTQNRDLPSYVLDNSRVVERYVAGANGEFSALGSTWKWQGYYQLGISRNFEQAKDVTATANFNNAVDAIAGPGGTIICRSTLTNPADGCVPYNVMGIGVNSDPLLDYLFPGNPYRHQKLRQSVVALSLSGEPFQTWAGPVSLAIGAERRTESVSGESDARSQAGGWASGNYRPTFGRYTVKEAFAEIAVPLLKNDGLGDIDLNGAVRGTDYSTSGYVTTWKAGFVYTPTPGLRLRLTRSRDIRAPNLAELYQGASSVQTVVMDRFNGNRLDTAQSITLGNLNLKPEKADTLSLGVVAQPGSLPGLSVSIDYFNIKLKDGIGSINSIVTMDRCFDGLTVYCNAIIRAPGILGPDDISMINQQPYNIASRVTKGLDIESSYRFALSDIFSQADGDIVVRLLGSHYIKDVLNDTLVPPVDAAGSYTLPKWIYTASLLYSSPKWNVMFTGRGTSSTKIGTNIVQCEIGCPVSTTANPTYDRNHVDGSFFLDASLTRKIQTAGGAKLQAFLSVTNVFNSDPPIAITSRNFSYITPQTYSRLYSQLGRTFRAGVRFAL